MKKIGGELFTNENGRIKFSENAFESKLKFHTQEYMMSAGIGQENTDQISKYLESKSNNIVGETRYINGITNKKINDKIMQYIKNKVTEHFENGDEVSLYIANSSSVIGFIDPNTGRVYHSTLYWKEPTGHVVKVTGMTDIGFIVSTWGKRCLVPFKDLQNSGAFAMYFTKIKTVNFKTRFKARTPELKLYYDFKKRAIDDLYNKYNVTEAEDALIEDMLMKKINNATSIYNFLLEYDVDDVDDVEEAINIVRGRTENGK